ncbi:hypothetical protein M1O55_04225 [Dehalococcoidia bacterium]|nr:hypothetical protein [Dehalococcoidia bacterium]
MKLKIINLTKVGLGAAALMLVLYTSLNHVFVAMAQSSGYELVATSIDGGGGEMSGGSLSMNYAVAEGQPIGAGSSASYTLDSGFVPIIAQSFQPNVASTPTPAPTATPVPNVWDAPSTSGWGLAILAAGMLVVLVITLRLTSGNRRTT